MLIKVVLVFISNLISSILIYRWLQSPQKKFSLTGSNYQTPLLKKVIKAGCNSNRIVFCWCILDFDSDIDISGPEYKTTYLSFRGTGCRSNWSSYPSRLKKMLKVISLCSLKTSLQTLDIYKCGLEVSEVEEMLKDFNLEHVKVVRENDDSLDE